MAVVLAVVSWSLKSTASGESDNRSLDGDAGSRPLDRESVMEVVRADGYVPESQGDWISFMVQGQRYLIGVENLPYLSVLKSYDLDCNRIEVDLLREAVRRISDDLFLAKAVIWGEKEDSISFQVCAIEDKYTHFKDCLPRYVNLVNMCDAEVRKLYYELVEQRRKEALASLSGQGIGDVREKKVRS